MNLIDRLRQNIFPIAITILTFVLLIVFGIQQSEEKGISNGDVVKDFYSATLKPIFSSQEIDKEDVLNFALEGDLILDAEENKVLQLSNDSTGKEIIGIKIIEANSVENNYDKVVKKLEQEGYKKAKLDSILESYYARLSKSVYQDKNKVYAVDPEIGQLRSELNSELSNLVRDKKIRAERNQNYASRKAEKVREFIVFAPDTVLQREYEFYSDNAELKIPEEISIPKIKEVRTNNSPREFTDLDYIIDSNLINVTLDNSIDIEDFEDIHFFKTFIDSTNDNLNFSFRVLGDSLENIVLKLDYPDSANKLIHYEISSEEIGNAVSNSIKIFSGKDLDDWIEFGIKMDSISRKLEENKKTKSEKDKGNN